MTRFRYVPDVKKAAVQRMASLQKSIYMLCRNLNVYLLSHFFQQPLK
jgi:hypothetical protein